MTIYRHKLKSTLKHFLNINIQFYCQILNLYKRQKKEDTIHFFWNDKYMGKTKIKDENNL